MSEPFIGEIRMFGGNFAPKGWAFCQGQILPIAQNTALFSLLGTTYGGNGQTTFGLPDLRGRVPVGQGTGPGLSPVQLGQQAGTESVTLLSSQMPAHTHTAATTVRSDSSTLTAQTAINVRTGVPPASRLPTPVDNVLSVPTSAGNPVNGFAAATAGTAAQMAPEAATTTLAGAVTATATTTVDVAGGSQPTSIMQPYLGVNYIIALQGIFPSRN